MEALVDGRVVEKASAARLLPSLGAAVHAAVVPSHAASRRRMRTEFEATRRLGRPPTKAQPSIWQPEGQLGLGDEDEGPLRRLTCRPAEAIESCAIIGHTWDVATMEVVESPA